eukprot:CAMPEP_0118941282 /NCGR_PEP_ID=MMETSP1169-20130426/33494_1 /TAXON_ID=36882 /ORGANISM="Pyramimonas obovata, Strain CCMP722" /LENGTH=468 /DNA_ID=CAMNT_0006885989 /DNA_START=80 /DNA_END=1486 /DNA_ORIENTATION=-
MQHSKSVALLFFGHLISAQHEDTRSPPFSSKWYKGRADYAFTQTPDIVKWEPQNPQVVITHFRAERISATGDIVKKRLRWMSTGGDACPLADYSSGNYCKGSWPCAHRSVSCLAGTGDFRIGLFDSLTEEAGYVDGDGFADANQFVEMNKQLAASPFSKYRGYHVRFSPHISRQARSYHDQNTGEHSPGGFYVKDRRGTLFTSSQVGDVGNIGGFDLNRGEWAELKLEMTRLSSLAISLKIEMNGTFYQTTHTWPSEKEAEQHCPNLLDTIALMYPNGRRYYYVQLADPDLKHPIGSLPSPASPPSKDEFRRPRISANETIHALVAEASVDDEIDYQWRAVWNSKLLTFSPLQWIDNQFGVHLVSHNHYHYAVLVGLAAATVLCLCSMWIQCRAQSMVPLVSNRFNPAALSLSATTLAFGSTRDPETFKYRKPIYGAQAGSAFYSQPPVEMDTVPSYREQRRMRFAGL